MCHTILITYRCQHAEKGLLNMPCTWARRSVADQPTEIPVAVGRDYKVMVLLPKKQKKDTPNSQTKTLSLRAKAIHCGAKLRAMVQDLLHRDPPAAAAAAVEAPSFVVHQDRLNNNGEYTYQPYESETCKDAMFSVMIDAERLCRECEATLAKEKRARRIRAHEKRVQEKRIELRAEMCAKMCTKVPAELRDELRADEMRAEEIKTKISKQLPPLRRQKARRNLVSMLPSIQEACDRKEHKASFVSTAERLYNGQPGVDVQEPAVKVCVPTVHEAETVAAPMQGVICEGDEGVDC